MGTNLCLVPLQILADRVGIPCKLVKGSNYTGGDDDDAINIIKMDNERYQYVLSVHSLHSIVTYFLVNIIIKRLFMFRIISTKFYSFVSTICLLSAFILAIFCREFLVDRMAAPGTLIPADVLSGRGNSLKSNQKLDLDHTTGTSSIIDANLDPSALQLEPKELPASLQSIFSAN
jgi:hypothetical protein